MDLLGRIISLMIGAFLLGLAVWFSLWLFLLLFCVGIAAAGWFWLRAYLLEKEILNPQPGVHIEQIESHETVIEGDYEEMKDKS